MTAPYPKKHRINKQNSKQTQQKFTKFFIRPPVFTMSSVKVEQHFDKFKIKLKDAIFKKVSIKIKQKKDQKIELQQKIMLSNKPINSFSEFIQTRRSASHIKEKNKMKKNLGSCSLKEVIKIYFQQGLMLNFYYSKFQKNFNEEQQKSIIRTFEQNKQKLTFKSSIFTIIDHRMFSEILVKNFQDKYQINQLPAYSSIELIEFYKNMYEQDLQQYFQEWDQFNSKYRKNKMPLSSQLYNNIEYFRCFHQI